MFKGKKIKKPSDLVKATRSILLTMDKKGTDHKDHEKVTPSCSLFFSLHLSLFLDLSFLLSGVIGGD